MTTTARTHRLVTVSAIAVACLALGSTGGAVAGSMITGKQIKNGSVTGKDLKDGSVGAADLASGAVSGGAGASGPAGPAGAAGPAGPAGPITGVLPSGVTLTGVYAASAPDGTANGSSVYSAISFGLRLPSGVPATVVPRGADPKPPQCPGTVFAPAAAPGHLCLYRQFENGLSGPSALALANAGSPDTSSATLGSAGPTGAGLDFDTIAPGSGTLHIARGTWAVTAP